MNYYAYFTSSEAKTLFAFIRNHGAFPNEFDYGSAEEWMSRVERSGADVWFYVA